MTTEYLIKVCTNDRIRQSVVNMSKAFTRNRVSQEWLFAQGWIAIAESDHDKTEEYYIGLAYAVMRNKYELYVMEVYPSKRCAHDAGIQRANKFVKKYAKSKD